MYHWFVPKKPHYTSAPSQDLRVLELILHLTMDDVFRTDDSLHDKRVALPSTGNFLDDDVVPRVHQVAAIRVRFDDAGLALGQRVDGFRPRQTKIVAEEQLADQRLHVALVRALDALNGRGLRVFFW